MDQLADIAARLRKFESLIIALDQHHTLRKSKHSCKLDICSVDKTSNQSMALTQHPTTLTLATFAILTLAIATASNSTLDELPQLVVNTGDSCLLYSGQFACWGSNEARPGRQNRHRRRPTRPRHSSRPHRPRLFCRADLRRQCPKSLRSLF